MSYQPIFTKDRLARVFIGSILPPVIGVILLAVPGAIIYGLDKPRNYLGLILVAYFFMGIQSFLYSVLIEYWITEKFQSKSKVLLASSIMGMICGLTLFAGRVSFNAFATKAALGMLVGLITGLILLKLRSSD
ncbi:MAG: hypothetical protein HWE16_19050 [Gammaproteobacteria bacterium]|nr:hypothetical protein [Gammaproteobacteria bacterium]